MSGSCLFEITNYECLVWDHKHRFCSLIESGAVVGLHYRALMRFFFLRMD
ncbi:hypothetical protein C5S53_15285 [Methanophagales archaeon]|nr:hypothetical protein C5S53_15285 [Methanophagales archaeon]